MDCGFGVHRQHYCTGVHERGNVPVGLGNHEMNIQGELCHFPDRPDYWGTDRDVGHEVTIHHVDMKRVSAGFLDFSNLVAKRGEIRGQDRGRNANAHWLTSRRMMSDLLRRYPASGS